MLKNCIKDNKVKGSVDIIKLDTTTINVDRSEESYLYLRARICRYKLQISRNKGHIEDTSASTYKYCNTSLRSPRRMMEEKRDSDTDKRFFSDAR